MHPPKKWGMGFNYSVLPFIVSLTMSMSLVVCLRNNGFNYHFSRNCSFLCNICKDVVFPFSLFSIRTTGNPDCRWNPVYNVKSNVGCLSFKNSSLMLFPSGQKNLLTPVQGLWCSTSYGLIKDFCLCSNFVLG